MQLTLTRKTFPLHTPFRISRGERTHQEVLQLQLEHAGIQAQSECIPYAHFGQTFEKVEADLGSLKSVRTIQELEQIQQSLTTSAAQNLIDCILIDFESKSTGKPAYETLKLPPPKPVITAHTISLNTPEAMARQAAEKSAYPLLKLKLGSNQDKQAITAVRKARPTATLILDPNEGWTPDNFEGLYTCCKANTIAMIEQPLKPEHEHILAQIKRTTPVYADESCHGVEDLERLKPFYDGINIKLDKAGGLRPALKLKQRAESLGYEIMVGCMLASSLAMAPAVLLAQNVKFTDLDGPLYLAEDTEPALTYQGATVLPPSPDLWG